MAKWSRRHQESNTAHGRKLDELLAQADVTYAYFAKNGPIGRSTLHEFRRSPNISPSEETCKAIAAWFKDKCGLTIGFRDFLLYPVLVRAPETFTSSFDLNQTVEVRLDLPNPVLSCAAEISSSSSDPKEEIEARHKAWTEFHQYRRCHIEFGNRTGRNSKTKI